MYRNKISDITPLKELTNLRTLNLQGNGISDDDIKELDHALPKCTVNSNLS
ncbi:hypothetical protein SH2C18_45460 [Clostridium sediminicola]|uniref:leucine-rich repeat domain-containing protein n=1 Tax=Clostridium sediminicola TaxID=3114879 RepID=UPI0031F233E2